MVARYSQMLHFRNQQALLHRQNLNSTLSNDPNKRSNAPSKYINHAQTHHMYQLYQEQQQKQNSTQSQNQYSSNRQPKPPEMISFNSNKSKPLRTDMLYQSNEYTTHLSSQRQIANDAKLKKLFQKNADHWSGKLAFASTVSMVRV